MLVPFVNAVVAVTVMYVLLFVLHVFMLRECGGDGNAGVGAVVTLSTGCAYMGGTRGSCVVSTGDDVLQKIIIFI